MRRYFFIFLLMGCVGGAGICLNMDNILAAPTSPSIDDRASSGPDQKQEASSSPGSEMTDIHDIKSLERVALPLSFTTIAGIAFIGFLVCATVIAGWLYWRQRKKNMHPIEIKIVPDEKAFQQLAALETDNTLGDKEYYFRLSTIFREYLEGRYGIDAPEMTTEELLPQLDKLALDRTLNLGIKAFIGSCDPVKFANERVPEEKKITDVSLVKMFVTTTRPEEQDDTTAEQT